MTQKIVPNNIFVFGLASALAVVSGGCGRRAYGTLWSQPIDQAHWVYSAAGVKLRGGPYGDLLLGVRGGAEAYFGSAQGLSKKPGWVWRSDEREPGKTGYCVGSAGRFSGDPYPVIYVSAPRARQRGVVYLFKTGPHGPQAKPWRVLLSPDLGEGFGERVVCAGDLYGDGYDDLAVGDFSSKGNRGSVYVYRGGPNGPGPEPDWRASGERPGDWFGYSLCAPGDLDGDGLDDLVIGSKNCDGSCLTWMNDNPDLAARPDFVRSAAWSRAGLLPMAGRLSVFYGSEKGLSVRPGLVMEGDSAHEMFAYSVAGAGRLQGGRAALLVGSIGWRDRRGVVELYAGGPKGLPLRRLWQEPGSYAGEGLGEILDVVPGALEQGSAALLAGGMDQDDAWLYGPLGLDGRMRKARLWSPPTRAHLNLMGSAGDIYGNGQDEIFVGVPGNPERLLVLRIKR